MNPRSPERANRIKQSRPKSPVALNNNHHAEKTGASAEIDRFVGPIGAVVMMIALPLLTQFLWFSCSAFGCSEYNTISFLWDSGFVRSLEALFPNPSLFSVQVVVTYFVAQWLLHVIMPSATFLGYALPDGTRLNYKVNGLYCLLTSITIFATAAYLHPIETSTFAARYIKDFGRVLVFTQMFSFGVAGFLYLKGFLYRQGNPSGNFIVDYFYGYEMNPRIFDTLSTDFKWFFEGRALIQWELHALLIGYLQYTQLGYLPSAMLLTILLHSWYCFHYHVHETHVLSMVDFTGDHMGWMLTWGNNLVVPFLYLMPELFLLAHPRTLHPLVFAGIVLLFGFGYYLFSQANTQKRNFRTSPGYKIWGEYPRIIETETPGKPLLVSGWWGVARHINYTGDLIQAWCYGLPSMSLCVAPFINGIFLTGLILQREGRDHHWCHLKYGRAWEEYCRRVPYRLIPGIY